MIDAGQSFAYRISTRDCLPSLPIKRVDLPLTLEESSPVRSEGDSSLIEKKSLLALRSTRSRFRVDIRRWPSGCVSLFY